MTTTSIDNKSVVNSSNKYSVFKTQDWYYIKYDARKRIFRGISKEDFREACKLHRERMSRKAYFDFRLDEYQNRRRLIKLFADIPYSYDGDGLDDYSKYQRPSTNGIAYVAICPGERGNNIYIDDPILVKYLMAKFDKHMAAHPDDRADMQP